MADSKIDTLRAVNEGPVVAALIGYVIFVCTCPAHGVVTLAVSTESSCGFCTQSWKIKKFHYTDGEPPVVEVVPANTIITPGSFGVPRGRA